MLNTRTLASSERPLVQQLHAQLAAIGDICDLLEFPMASHLVKVAMLDVEEALGGEETSD